MVVLSNKWVPDRRFWTLRTDLRVTLALKPAYPAAQCRSSERHPNQRRAIHRLRPADVGGEARTLSGTLATARTHNKIIYLYTNIGIYIINFGQGHRSWAPASPGPIICG